MPDPLMRIVIWKCHLCGREWNMPPGHLVSQTCPYSQGRHNPRPAVILIPDSPRALLEGA